MKQDKLTGVQKVPLALFAYMYNSIPIIAWLFTSNTIAGFDGPSYSVLNTFSISGKLVTKINVVLVLLMCFWHLSSWGKDSFKTYQQCGVPSMSLLSCIVVPVLSYIVISMYKTVQQTVKTSNAYFVFWLLLIINTIFYAVISIYVNHKYNLAKKETQDK